MPLSLAKVLETSRLQLVAGSAGMLWAEQQRRDLFARILDVAIPQCWPPPFFESFSSQFLHRLAERPDQEGWYTWYIRRKASEKNTPGELLGCVGFTGPPAANGLLTIGYGVLEAHQGHGYCTEALNAVTAWAFANRAVHGIVGETYAELRASIRVLEKCGFTLTLRPGQRGALRYLLPREFPVATRFRMPVRSGKEDTPARMSRLPLS